LRRRRAAARAADRVPQGSDLAAGLDRYSAKGQQYVEIIRSVIRVNELARFDG
jgi:Bax protein